MDQEAAVIDIRNLFKGYTLGKEKVPVLHHVDLQVMPGDYVAIMGQSGSGKSTLLNIVGCLDSPDSGTFAFCGRDISQCSESVLADMRNREIGFVFQNFNLLPKLDVFGNVELPLVYGNIPRSQRREKVELILHRMGLWERRKHRPNEISGGQKQRVAIARALVKQPAVILADEPTGNLDSHTTEEILAILEELHNQKNTIVMITHEPDVAARAKRKLRLVDGTFVS
jgi:putative ABC transport system ATP-binding protein